jgi:hypothetical protein
MTKEMAPGASPHANWRDPEQYRPLLDFDCVGWAGQWLSRNPEFLERLRQIDCVWRLNGEGILACRDSCPLVRWGLRCCVLASAANFLWLPDVNPFVLLVEADSAMSAADTFALHQCPLLKAVVQRADDGQHLLFSDGQRHLQVQVTRGDALAGIVCLCCQLRGLRAFENKSVSLRRLCYLHRRGRLLKSLYPPERRARRWIEMLRAWDGRTTGASQRDIALALFGDRAATTDWEAGYRTRMQRLLRGARALVDGGYLKILIPDRKGKAGLAESDG